MQPLFRLADVKDRGENRASAPPRSERDEGKTARLGADVHPDLSAGVAAL